MVNQPLQPFAPPTILLSYLPGGFSAGAVVVWLLLAVFVFWTIYTLVAIYHWFKYSNASWVMFPAVAAHICISIALMAYTLSGNAFFLTKYLP